MNPDPSRARTGKGDAAAPIEARNEREFGNDLGYIHRCLGGRGAEPSGADIPLSFVGGFADGWTKRSQYPTQGLGAMLPGPPAYWSAAGRAPSRTEALPERQIEGGME